MKIDVYEIEDNVPVPTGDNSLPPLAQLEVGQSILFSLAKRRSVQSVASRIKRETGKAFRVKKVDEDNARIWRVE